ncbi:hypothetical protein COOONC_16321, partial [Cooperia oncophora]
MGDAVGPKYDRNLAHVIKQEVTPGNGFIVSEQLQSNDDMFHKLVDRNTQTLGPSGLLASDLPVDSKPYVDKSMGLRHFSTKVCEKVKEKGRTNYNQVADELVAEYFAANNMNSEEFL